MAGTVLGVFADAETAQSAIRKLVDMGASTDDIDAYPIEADESALLPAEHIKGYFTALFTDPETVNKHLFMASRSIVVAVSINDNLDGDDIVKALDEAGALNIEDYVLQYYQDYRADYKELPPIEGENAAQDNEKVYKQSRLINKGVDSALRLRKK